MKQLVSAVRLSLLALVAAGLAAGVASAQDAEKGKQIYNTICVACHGPDPKVDGPIGPSMTDASEDLLRARVIEAKYPAGYKPKRDTNMMPPMPQYKDNIKDIKAFLDSL